MSIPRVFVILPKVSISFIYHANTIDVNIELRFSYRDNITTSKV